jgi:hypothetical protein
VAASHRIILQDTFCNCIFLSSYIGAEQGTPLRGDVGTARVTSHQLCVRQKFQGEVALDPVFRVDLVAW